MLDSFCANPFSDMKTKEKTNKNNFIQYAIACQRVMILKTSVGKFYFRK